MNGLGPSPNSGGRPAEFSEPPGRATQEQLLNEVLRETNALAAANKIETSHLQQLLVDVAAGFRGQALTAYPVAAALVEAILKHCFRNMATPPDFWETAARHIAEILLDDPAAREKLTRIWDRLGWSDA